MTYLPEVRDALASTVAAHTHPGTEVRSRRIRRLLRIATPVSLTLASLGIGAVILLNVHGQSAQSTHVAGRRPRANAPVAWRRDYLRAVTRVAERDHRCQIPLGGAKRHHQQLLRGRPEPELVAELGVLRRPAPRLARVTARQIRKLDVDAQGIYVRYARHGVVDGISYYLIPVAHLEPNQLPESCFAQRLAVFVKLTDRLPASRRRAAIAYARSLIREQRGPAPAGIALMDTGGGSTGGSFRTVQGLRADPWQGGSGGSNTITKTFLLVPNSVATVTAHYSRQTYPGRVRTPITITKRVTGNLVGFVFRGAWDPPALTYRSVTGQVLGPAPRHEH